MLMRVTAVQLCEASLDGLYSFVVRCWSSEWGLQDRRCDEELVSVPHLANLRFADTFA